MTKNRFCKAACVEVDITPDFPVELIGCDREDSRAKGVLHPLFAQILLIEAGDDRYVLITVDSLGLTIALSNELRQLIAERLGTLTGNVMLNFSHTHSAPAPLSPLNGRQYYGLLCERIIDGAVRAKKQLAFCLAGWSVGETDIAENRRDSCQAVDRRLGALQFVRKDDLQPIALVLRVSAHANVLMACNDQISSDYLGLARSKIANEKKCPVMIVQGAAGNLKPVGVDKIYGGQLDDAIMIAEMLTTSVRQLKFKFNSVELMTMYEHEMDFYSEVPSEETAEKIADEAYTLFKIDGSEWLRECAKLRAQGVSRQIMKETIHFFQLNEGCFCGLPDEIFCEISIEAAKRKGSHLFFLNGYTNGCTGYLPHEAEWYKGGYETLYSFLSYYMVHGHVMPFAPDTAERILKTIALKNL